MRMPYDARIGAWFWKGSSVADQTIDSLLDRLQATTPNVRAIFVKVSNGSWCQGGIDTIASELDINGVQDITRWVEKCTSRGIDLYCWSVVRGKKVEDEIRILTSVAQVEGVRLLIFDLEVGEDYFVGGRQAAKLIASQVRKNATDDFHLSLCLDGRGTHPQSVFIEEWLPYVNSLQPMVYYDSFFPHLTNYDAVAKQSLDKIMQNLARYERPILPIFPARAKVRQTMQMIAQWAIDHYAIRGYSLWRLGPSLYSAVTEEIKQLAVPQPVSASAVVYKNQQVIDAIAKAAVYTNSEPQQWLVSADLEHLTDNRNGSYLGPDIMALPGLSEDQKRLVTVVLHGEALPVSRMSLSANVANGNGNNTQERTSPISNQEVINAVLAVARDMGDEGQAWVWFREAGLNSILTDRERRQEPYISTPIADLPNLSAEVKKAISAYLDHNARPRLTPEDGRQPITSVALRGVNIDLGDDRFSPENLKPFTCCRLVFDMSMNKGNTDFDAALTKYNQKISTYIADGVTPILVLNHEFYGEGQGFDWNTMADNSEESLKRWKTLTEAYVGHLHKLVKKYGNRVVYEIWNEPDQRSVAAVFVPEVAFTHLLDRSIETIHMISPDAQVIVGGLVSGGATYWHKTRANMGNASGLAGIGIHPYGQEDNGRQLTVLLDSYAQGASVRFWLTEWGVLGDPDKSEPPPVDEKIVANYVSRFIKVAQSDRRVAAIIWYGYADGMHNGYGLVRKDGSRKTVLWESYTRGL